VVIPAIKRLDENHKLPITEMGLGAFLLLLLHLSPQIFESVRIVGRRRHLVSEHLVVLRMGRGYERMSFQEIDSEGWMASEHRAVQLRAVVVFNEGQVIGSNAMGIPRTLEHLS